MLTPLGFVAEINSQNLKIYIKKRNYHLKKNLKIDEF